MDNFLSMDYYKVLALIIILSQLYFPCTGHSKYSSVHHFTVKDGFPGKYAYRLLQDKAGYIWISTENGMTRFNGYEFKLFTVNDGLPDNEILNFSEGNEGRLLLIPFSNTIGYIKNGRVYNSGNDELINKLHFQTKTECILSDRLGNIVIAERNKVTCITKDEKINAFTFKNKAGSIQSFNIFKSKANDIYLADYSGNLYQYSNQKWIRKAQLPDVYNPICIFAIELLGLEKANLFLKQIQKDHLPFYYEEADIAKFNSMCFVAPGILGVARSDGFFLINAATSKIIDTMLYGTPISMGLVSSDSSLWLCSHGDGVYRFMHSPVHSLPLKNPAANVTYIKAREEYMYAAIEKGRFVRALSPNPGEAQVSEINIPHYKWPDQIFRFIGQNKHMEWIGLNNRVCIFKALNQAPVDISGPIAFKDIFEEDDQHLLVATYACLSRFDKDNKIFTDTLLTRRNTCVAVMDDIIYAGSLDGLFCNDGKKTFRKILSTEAALNTHITKLCSGTDSTLWIANNKAEVIALRHHKIAALMNHRTGLRCNKISAIKTSKKFVFVGTDNGIYILHNKAPYYIAGHVNHAMGLNSNIINCLDYTNETLWVGTAEGINYFNQNDLFKWRPAPRLIITNISNDSVGLLHSESIQRIPLQSLTIEFDVIDHIGGQKPLFQYRLNDDSNWIKIENTQLYFPELPYGHSSITIRAESPNWKTALSKKLGFYRPYPFYMQWWFILLALSAFGGITALAVYWFIRKTRKQDQEKAAFQRRLLKLEQMALQGQMNPHFIFNCISAIKQFYSNGDNAKANIFVDKFAALIRQTFEMGTQLFVPLDKEISYLHQYLSIEQTRFDESFHFMIEQDIEHSAAEIYIPVMLLQPLAENAVRHGIRHLAAKEGKITVQIKQRGDLVTVTVTDNGVGREKSKTFGRLLQQDNQLTSTTVNTKRIELLNELFEKRISYTTEDILDEHNTVAGTRVIISYPLSMHEIHN